jgi:hypothetical protein
MTDRAQRLVLWIVALALVAGTGLALRFARGYRPLAGLPPVPSPFDRGDGGLRFDGVTVVGRDRDRAAWTVNAGRVETTRSRGRVTFAGGIRADLLDAAGKSSATLTAPTATYDDLGRRLRLEGKIVCRVRDLSVTATRLEWDVGADQIRCPGPVRATLPRGEVRGEQLTVDVRSRAFRLRNVAARFLVNEAQDLAP